MRSAARWGKKNIDHTFIQSKMLNASKGPAVHSLRAQADKAEYSRRMRQILENQEHLVIKQAEVCDLLWDDVDSDTVSKSRCNKKSVVCGHLRNGIRSQSGYFVYRNLLKGTLPVRRIHHPYRPNGLQAANHLTDSLKEMGIAMRRFKTERLREWMEGVLIFPRWKSSSEIRGLCRFPLSTDPESVQIDQIPAG